MIKLMYILFINYIFFIISKSQLSIRNVFTNTHIFRQMFQEDIQNK